MELDESCPVANALGTPGLPLSAPQASSPEHGGAFFWEPALALIIAPTGSKSRTQPRPDPEPCISPPAMRGSLFGSGTLNPSDHFEGMDLR